MAGLYITFDKPKSTRLDVIANHMRFGHEGECRFESEVSYVWLSHDDTARFSPAIDLVTGVHCIVGGRLCWPTSTWQEAERLPYTGGLANRILLDRFLCDGPDAVTPFNGAVTVVIWDPRNRIVHLWTDQFGYHPAFLFCRADSTPSVFTTFPDAITKDSALDVQPDHVSMAEFLRAWRITPPHTYYKHLKHAGAATYQCINLNTGSVKKDEYWRPFETGFFSCVTDAADALAGALRESIGERTAISEKSAFFVSGGADSRVMLYAANKSSKVWGINLYERPTDESVVAKALCERAGATYLGFGRDNDYYPRMLEENVRWSGAMWSAEDNHYLGVQETVEQFAPDLVMTACTTDWVFKGYGLEKTNWRVLGKNLPIHKYIGHRVDGYLPNYPRPAPVSHADEISGRLENWFEGTPSSLKSDRDYLLVEDKRVRPACYTVSVSGQIMYRTYPFDCFLADSRVADCYSRIPAKWKLNGQVWGLAAAQICNDAADIVDSNFGWNVDANIPSKLFNFAKGWVKRRVYRPIEDSEGEDHPPSYASWPDFGWYAKNSDTLHEFWRSTPEPDRLLMAEIWGSDPWQSSLNDWASKPHELMRILTLLQHWRNQRKY